MDENVVARLADMSESEIGADERFAMTQPLSGIKKPPARAGRRLLDTHHGRRTLYRQSDLSMHGGGGLARWILHHRLLLRVQ
jgi:hypothetical protein